MTDSPLTEADQLPGTYVRLRFTTAAELDAAARVLTDSMRADEALTLRVPGDGGTRSLRDLLDRLDEYSLSAEALSVHTPDAHTPDVTKRA